MAPKIVNRQEKRRSILMAAMKVFAEKGFTKARMADIAETAGVGKGTIYEYFASREELFKETFLFFFEDFKKKSDYIIREVHSPAEQLSMYIKELSQTLRETHKDFLPVIMDFWAEGVRNRNKMASIHKLMKEAYTDFRHTLSGIISNGIANGEFEEIDPSLSASAIMAAVDGLFLQWVIDPQIFDLCMAVEEVADFFLKGILKRDRI